MKITIDEDDLTSYPALNNRVVVKLFNSREWDMEDFTHAEIQWCLTNDKPLENAKLYSPVLTETEMNEDVPVAWPNSAIYDENGDRVRQKTWFEFCQYLTVDGGYCIKYAGSAASATGNVSLPSDTQLRIWINNFGGFLTPAEAYALIVTE